MRMVSCRRSPKPMGPLSSRPPSPSRVSMRPTPAWSLRARKPSLKLRNSCWIEAGLVGKKLIHQGSASSRESGVSPVDVQLVSAPSRGGTTPRSTPSTPPTLLRKSVAPPVDLQLVEHILDVGPQHLPRAVELRVGVGEGSSA